MLLKSLDLKNRKIIQSSLANSVKGFSIFELFSYEDWANNNLPHPLTEDINKPTNLIEERLLLEGNWPLYWTYGISPSRMSSEDYFKIRKDQKDVFKAAINFNVFSRILYFQFDLNYVPEKNWPKYFENEIEIVKSKLSDRKHSTRVLREEIDYSYMSSLMCDYIEEAIVTGFQLVKASLQIDDIEFDIEDFDNDGWHGSKDPFNLGDLFQTYVNIQYLEDVKDMQVNFLKKTKHEIKSEEKTNRKKITDLIDVPSHDKGINQLIEEREYYNEKVRKTKQEIIEKARTPTKKSSLSDDQLAKIQAFAEQKRNKNKESCIKLLKFFEQHRERLAPLPYATCLREIQKLEDFTPSNFPSDRTLRTWIRDYQIQYQ